MNGPGGMGLLGPIGMGLQLAGAIGQGEAARQAGKFEAKVQDANARQAIADGEAEAGAIRDQVRMARGEQIAAQGASGFEVNQGSALTMLRESLIQGELDIAEARRSARSRAQAYRAAGAVAKAEGRNRFVGSLFGAAAAAGAGMGDWAQRPAEYGYQRRGW
jgi:hypothetical protein